MGRGTLPLKGVWGEKDGQVRLGATFSPSREPRRRDKTQPPSEHTALCIQPNSLRCGRDQALIKHPGPTHLQPSALGQPLSKQVHRISRLSNYWMLSSEILNWAFCNL